MSTQFIAVTGGRSAREIGAYLYRWSTVVELGEYGTPGRERFWAIVKVEDGGDAEYLAARYGSGMIAAKVVDSEADAIAHINFLIHL